MQKEVPGQHRNGTHNLSQPKVFLKRPRQDFQIGMSEATHTYFTLLIPSVIQLSHVGQQSNKSKITHNKNTDIKDRFLFRCLHTQLWKPKMVKIG